MLVSAEDSHHPAPRKGEFGRRRPVRVRRPLRGVPFRGSIVLRLISH